MSKFSFADADNYGGKSGGGTFFTLKDHKDHARVRFLYRTIDDVTGNVVHTVQVDGKDRYVECLKAYNDPIEKCPCCQAGLKQVPRLFIKMYNEDLGECQLWERSKKYFERLANLSAYYNPLCNEVVDVVRNGVAKDIHTTYDFMPVENSEFDIDSVECPDPLGTVILDKSYEEMMEYVQTGRFPEAADKVAGARTESRQELGEVRRTPATTEPARRAF